MKEYPLNVSGHMLRLLLTGKKTQISIPMKPQPEIYQGYETGEDSSDSGFSMWYPNSEAKNALSYGNEVHFRKGVIKDFCPLGQVGDRLWVREPFKRGHDSLSGAVLYKIDGHVKPGLGDFEMVPWMAMPRMERHESRLILTVLETKAQRLRETTNEEASEEGVELHGNAELDKQAWKDYGQGMGWASVASPKGSFATLWDIIYKKELQWQFNPWIWRAKVSVERWKSVQGYI